MDPHRFPHPSPADAEMPRDSGKVTIVMRTKDRPVLLARAFASVLAQTHTNWELRVVNDGAPEPVEALVRQYARAFGDRLIVKRGTSGGGTEAASNDALESSAVDYVAVHGDGDSWKPAFLEESVGFLADPAHARFAAVATNLTVIHEELVGDTVIERARQPWPFWRNRIDFTSILDGAPLPPHCVVVRQAALDAIGPSRDGEPALGDGDFTLRVLIAGDIAAIPNALAYDHRRRTVDGAAHPGHAVAAGQDLADTTHSRNRAIGRLLAREPAFAELLQVLFTRLRALEEKATTGDDSRAVVHLHRELKPLIDIMNAVLWPFRVVLAGIERLVAAFRRRP